MAGDEARALDAYLVASVRAGDARAFDMLVRRWQPKLLAHGWRLLRDEDGARDAVQSGWAEIVRSIDRLRDDGAFAAWAYRIITRRCARLIGSAQYRRRLAEALSSQPDDTPASASPVDRAALDTALATLPAEQRAAVALFYLEDMSIAEVAVALDVAAGTVKTRLLHARRKLRVALEGE